MIKNGKILLFDNIQIDLNLKKHKESVTNLSGALQTSTFNFSAVNNSLRGSNALSGIEHLEYLELYTPSLWIKFKIWLYKKMYKKKIKKNASISVEELQAFFWKLKYSISELDYNNIVEVISKYKTVLENAKANSQIALCEKLEEYVKTLKEELVLSTSKFNKFLEEEDVIKFYNKASKHETLETNLCLTYVKNFVKIIPNDVAELKRQAEDLQVFDNYVILHYDFEGNSVEDTIEEKEKKKDPILFGIIKGSKRLYYIGDWIDEYCDLTLDALIKTIGRDVRILDNENVSKNF